MLARWAAVPLGLVLRYAWIGASVASMCAAFVVARAPIFYARNHLSESARLILIVATLSGALLGVGCALVLVRRKPDWAPRIGRAAAPLALCAFLPGLFVRGFPPELSFLLFIGLFGFLLERLLTISFTELHERARKLYSATWARRLARLALAIGVAWYVYRVGHGTILVHQRLETSTSDLGEFNNLFFNALHGHPFRAPAMVESVSNWTALKIHAEFVLYLLLPIYAIAPRPETLLIIQTCFIAASSILVFAFAERRLGSVAAAAFALAFLCLPVVQRPNFYDFHFTPIGMFFVLAALLALDRGRLSAFVGLSVVVAASREDVAMGYAIACMALAWYGIARRWTLSVALGVGLYAFVMRAFVMPALGEIPFEQMYEGLQAPGFSGLKAIAITLITNPDYAWFRIATAEKLIYVLHFSAPLLFLWMRVPRFIAAALPGGVFTLLVTERPPLFQSSFQYVYLWLPYVVLASICVAASFGERLRHVAVAIGVFTCALACDAQYGVLLGGERILGGFGPKTLVHDANSYSRWFSVRAAVLRIPPTASVAATEEVGAHFSSRLDLFSLKRTVGDAEYLVILEPHLSLERPNVLEALQSGKYGFIERYGDVKILQRGAPTDRNAEISDALREEEKPH